MNTVRAMSGKCRGILKKPVAMNPAHYRVRKWCFQYHRKCDTVQYRCKSTYHWLILLRFEFWLSASDSQCDGPFVAPHSTGSVTDDTLPWLRLLLIVTLQRRLCDCKRSRGLYRSLVQTETRRRRRRTRGNGLGLSRAICVNDVARNKNILPMVALDEYHDTGLLQNTDCILLNRRYSRHFD